MKCRVRPDICIFLSPAITSFRRAASSRSAEAAAIQLNFRKSAGTSEALLRDADWCTVLHVCAADATALLCACNVVYVRVGAPTQYMRHCVCVRWGT